MDADEPVLDTQGLEVLSEETCREPLRQEPIGRVVFEVDHVSGRRVLRSTR